MKLPDRPKVFIFWDEPRNTHSQAIDPPDMKAYCEQVERLLQEADAEAGQLRKAATRIRCAWCGWATEEIPDYDERWEALQAHRKQCWDTFRATIAEGGMAYLKFWKERAEAAEKALATARADALHEAAEVCRARATGINVGGGWLDGYSQSANACAVAILSLIPAPGNADKAAE